MLNKQNSGGFGHKSFVSTPLAFFLSIILVFTMIPMAGFVATTDTSYAEADDSWVGAVSFDSAVSVDNSETDGWKWDATAKTLTLSGVNTKLFTNARK